MGCLQATYDSALDGTSSVMEARACMGPCLVLLARLGRVLPLPASRSPSKLSFLRRRLQLVLSVSLHPCCMVCMVCMAIQTQEECDDLARVTLSSGTASSCTGTKQVTSTVLTGRVYSSVVTPVRPARLPPMTTPPQAPHQQHRHSQHQRAEYAHGDADDQHYLQHSSPTAIVAL